MVKHGFLLSTLFFLTTVAMAGLLYWIDAHAVTIVMAVALFVAFTAFTGGLLGVYVKTHRSSRLRSFGMLTTVLTIAGLSVVLLAGVGVVEHSLLFIILALVYVPLALSLLIFKGLSNIHDTIPTRIGNLFVLFLLGFTVWVTAPVILPAYVLPAVWVLTLSFLAVISYLLWQELATNDAGAMMNQAAA